MHGNVWEWCLDVYADKLPGGTDPLVLVDKLRVRRGGGWVNDARDCRSATRGNDSQDVLGDGLGFRVALVADK